MKQLQRIFVLALLGAALAACSDDQYNYYELSDYKTVDFEGANLGEAGFIWGKPQATEQDDTDWQNNPIRSNIFYGPIYAEKDARFWTYYSDNGHEFDSWGSFVVSNRTDKKTEGYTNDTSVYADSGAAYSSQFAVAYQSAGTPGGKGIPTIEFIGGVKPVAVEVANVTYFYLYFMGSEKAEIVDVKGVITGYNSGVKTGEVSVTLADKASSTVKSGWETVDLTPLGMVTSITFTMSTTDEMCPAYYAIDNLIYQK